MFFSAGVCADPLCSLLTARKNTLGISLGFLLLLSLGSWLHWDCQGAEFGDSFQVWFANGNVWLSVGFPWCSWPMALHLFRFQWAHGITQMASCKWCLRNEKCMHVWMWNCAHMCYREDSPQTPSLLDAWPWKWYSHPHHHPQTCLVIICKAPFDRTIR